MLLPVVEEVVAPFDRRPQGALSVRDIASTRGQQIEAMPEPLNELLGSQHFHARGRELECERQTVEALRNRGNMVVGVE